MQRAHVHIDTHTHARPRGHRHNRTPSHITREPLGNIRDLIGFIECREALIGQPARARARKAVCTAGCITNSPRLWVYLSCALVSLSIPPLSLSLIPRSLCAHPSDQREVHLNPWSASIWGKFGLIALNPLHALVATKRARARHIINSASNLRAETFIHKVRKC